MRGRGGGRSSVPQRNTVGQGQERESSPWPDLANSVFATALESEGGRALFLQAKWGSNDKSVSLGLSPHTPS